MNTKLALIATAVFIVGCSSAPGRPSKDPIDLGSGKFLVEGSTLEQAQDRAKALCNGKGKEVGETRALVREFELTKITVVCK